MEVISLRSLTPTWFTRYLSQAVFALGPGFIQLTVSVAKTIAKKKKETLGHDWAALGCPHLPLGGILSPLLALPSPPYSCQQDLLPTMFLLQTLTVTFFQCFSDQGLLVKMWHIVGWFLRSDEIRHILGHWAVYKELEIATIFGL